MKMAVRMSKTSQNLIDEQRRIAAFWMTGNNHFGWLKDLLQRLKHWRTGAFLIMTSRRTKLA